MPQPLYFGKETGYPLYVCWVDFEADLGTGPEKLTPIGAGTQDLPAGSESLYLLRCPGPHCKHEET